MQSAHNIGALILVLNKKISSLILWIFILLSLFSGASKSEITVPEYVRIYNQGTNYYFGRGGITVDKEKACDYFEQSAEMDYTLAQFNIGTCYRSGIGREKNITQAIKWYKRAIENGDANSSISLATIYLYEQEDITQYQYSIDLLRQAISANKYDVGYAHFILGSAYYAGKGVEQDYNKAMENYYKAASHGNASAIALLSHIFSEGLYGVKKDKVVAQEWKLIIENKYDHRSQKNWKYEELLQPLRMKGIGVPRATR